MAYETRRHYPSERLWITNEIIHNPSVNAHLREMDVQFIPVDEGVKDFSGVANGDVVILPAFGATVQEMQLLNELGCHIVDTTCPWVSKVWNTVEKHKKNDITSIIHGKVKHEETLATSSFAGTYLVVLDLTEAQLVCDYILRAAHAADAQERAAARNGFMARFANACSPGFDPDRDLERVGVANQTTMLKSETEEIGRMFERTMLQRFGPLDLNEHFVAFNTICDATQERQDALQKLMSESALRFGRGVPPVLAETGSVRAAELLRELAGGQEVAGLVDAYPRPQPTVTVTLPAGEIRRQLGLYIPPYLDAWYRQAAAMLGN
jgi:4-hydroxy-3-methylbut-2-enyl diphosphate reductase